MAWLNVTPTGHKEERYKVFGWSVPEIAEGETLHEVWHELGEARDGQPLQWHEMHAYATLTQTTMTPEHWRILRDMSVAYCVQSQRKSPFEISPIDRLQDD